MFLEILRAKIHNAAITETNLYYEGSLTLDEELLDVSGIKPYERVVIVNINNGVRFDTYVIKGGKGKREVCLNGAAARLGMPGDRVIIMAYSLVEMENVPENYEPVVVIMDSDNKVHKVLGKK